tara:strand:+ start:158 stop:313 length:156 start_codon:yes stop_codon:yes gene_type:complete
LFLIINNIEIIIKKEILVLKRRKKEIAKEIFEIRSILGTKVAGMTIKLDNI